MSSRCCTWPTASATHRSGEMAMLRQDGVVVYGRIFCMLWCQYYKPLAWGLAGCAAHLGSSQTGSPCPRQSTGFAALHSPSPLSVRANPQLPCLCQAAVNVLLSITSAHLANQPPPPCLCSLTDLRREQQTSRPDGVLQRTRRCTRVLPSRCMAFLPFWPEAAEVGAGHRVLGARCWQGGCRQATALMQVFLAAAGLTLSCSLQQCCAGTPMAGP